MNILEKEQLINLLNTERIDIDAETQYCDPTGELRERYIKANDMLDRCIAIVTNFIPSFDVKQGTNIWYTNSDEHIIEHGIVSYIKSNATNIISIGINFDIGDYDEFDGDMIGVCLFFTKEEAELELINYV